MAAKQRQKKVPAVPQSAFSIFGPLPVTRTEGLEDGKALGLVTFTHRTIAVESDAAPIVQLQAYWHEVTHVALWDAGCHNTLSHDQNEAVCDAVGAYLAAASAAGYVVTRNIKQGR